MDTINLRSFAIVYPFSCTTSTACPHASYELWHLIHSNTATKSISLNKVVVNFEQSLCTFFNWHDHWYFFNAVGELEITLVHQHGYISNKKRSDINTGLPNMLISQEVNECHSCMGWILGPKDPRFQARNWSNPNKNSKGPHSQTLRIYIKWFKLLSEAK